ncbi:MAG: TetR/AcrR family transcriptional regulator [Phycisphaerae bacterium]|nr:TetR/AcrR family transcriptional regulator [Phycisphaerae bacterium]
MARRSPITSPATPKTTASAASRAVRATRSPRTAATRPDLAGLLDAAESIVLRDGIGHFTLDGVAREAGLSKSGLLHHFPSKELLIDALVRRKVDDWQRDVAEGVAKQPAGRGRTARAILGTCLSSTDKWTDSMRRSSVVLVAALVHDPKHVEPLRIAQRQMASRFADDGLPFGTSEAIHLAVNGLWFDWIFGLSDWTPPRLAAVRTALQRLLETNASPAAVPSSRRAKRPSSRVTNERK